MNDYAAPHAELADASIADLQAGMAEGRWSARDLVAMYRARIAALDRDGPSLRAVLELNPDAAEIAAVLDRERAQQGPRGPLHGIPILVKDNIATDDHMETTAGSLALLGVRPPRDAYVAARLRQAGAVLLGKANLSEWANFRSTHSSSGWSARGGQCRNPHALDRTPCGSSAGSAVVVAAGLAAAALGTETDGSILCPAAANGVVGIKPTVGLVSRAGIIPIAHSQDTAGPIGRGVRDVAALLSALAGADGRDAATSASLGRTASDYTAFLRADALAGARIGVPRDVYFGYSEKADAVAEGALVTLRELGATVIDPANIPTAQQLRESDYERTVLLYEFKADLNAYLAELGSGTPVRTLTELIAFNRAHAAEEMPYFGQEMLEMAETMGTLEDEAYLQALAACRRLARYEGVDAVMDTFQLDAIVMPTLGPAWKIDLIAGDHARGGSPQPSAVSGYPAVTVPAGDAFGLPIGLTFVGRAFGEGTLLGLAYAFEQATHAWHVPAYVATTP